MGKGCIVSGVGGEVGFVLQKTDQKKKGKLVDWIKRKGGQTCGEAGFVNTHPIGM
jgi:hypothetical protein